MGVPFPWLIRSGISSWGSGFDRQPRKLSTSGMVDNESIKILCVDSQPAGCGEGSFSHDSYPFRKFFMIGVIPPAVFPHHSLGKWSAL
jgi:hypothetical protein